MIIGYHETIANYHSTFGTSLSWNMYYIPFNNKVKGREYKFCYLSGEISWMKISVIIPNITLCTL